MNLPRRTRSRGLYFGVLLSLLLLVGAAGAQAQDFPTKPIHLIVPFSTGGGTDTSARIVADKLGKRLGQTVIVENRSGASGNIGTAAVARMPADGYTLLLGFDGTLVINPFVYPNFPFDTLRDFTPVTKLGDVALVLVANPSLPARNLAELLAYSKANPGKFTYASPGVGTVGFHEAGNFVPILRGSNADLNMTLGLAIISIVAIQYFGFKTLGFHYSTRFLNFKGPIDFFLGILELISQFANILSFTFRLFGNIFAGEVLLTVMAFLMPFIVPLPFMALELFVGFIQALVFSMLTAAFLNVAVSHGEGGEV